MAEAEILLPERGAPVGRRALAGALLVAGAAALFAVNGTVSKLVLGAGLPAQRLTEIRAAGASLTLLLVLLAGRRTALLRVRRAELPRLAAYGVIGLALVQWLYFVAIKRLPVGIGLLLEFTAPVLILLWERLGRRRPVSRRAWTAAALAFGGLALVAEVWHGGALDGLGVAAGLGAAVGLAVYYIVGERLAAERDAVSLSCLAFLVAAAFWSVLRPWWTFPAAVLTDPVALPARAGGAHAPVWLLVAWVVLLGTVVPYLMVVRALSQLPATRVGVLGMLEPPLAALAAFWWLGEDLSPAQLLGGAVVLAGIFLAQTSRPAPGPSISRRPGRPLSQRSSRDG